uniref:Mg2+ transporter protein, CorA family protein n=1 Tax=Rhodopseudomonas palustris (strain BisA53) TaxID=316055 RepID=Q07I06_RHOP5
MPSDNPLACEPRFAAAPPASSVATPVPGLVWAFRIDREGHPHELSVEQPLPSVGDDLMWLHFNLADARALQWLSLTDLPISPPARTLLLSRVSYQQLHVSDDCVHGVIADLRRDFDGESDEAGYLRFVMLERMLISGRYSALCAVDATRRSLQAGRRVDSIAALFESIIEHAASTMERVVDRLGHDLDEIEEEVLSDEEADLRKGLGQLRRTCVRLHRQLSGLQQVFHRLEQKNVTGVKPGLQIAAAKLAQRLDGLDRVIIEMRERARLLQEELQLKVEEQGNNNLRLLSVLTALLMPPTLITGVFGMNTKALPFADSEVGFWWAAVLIAGASLASYLVLRRIGVIR